MPTYTYECKKCGLARDVFHPMSASPRVKCEACGGGCKRLFGTGAGIIFKGSGFYETDYKKGNGKHTSKPAGEKPAEAKSETKTETKTETKSETKSESKSTNQTSDKS